MASLLLTKGTASLSVAACNAVAVNNRPAPVAFATTRRSSFLPPRRYGVVRAAEGQPSSKEAEAPQKDIEKAGGGVDFPAKELHEQFNERSDMTLDPSVVAAQKQQSRPVSDGEGGIVLAGPTTGQTLSQPGTLQSFMSDELSDIVEDTSSEGALAQSDVAPTSPAVDAKADKLLGADGWNETSSEGALAESDIAPTPVADLEKRGGAIPRASGTSSEGALAESDIAPTPMADVEKRGGAIPQGTENLSSRSTISSSPTAGLEGRGGALQDSKEAEDTLEKVISDEKPLASNEMAPLTLDSESDESSRAVSSEGSLAESDIAPSLSDAIEETAEGKTHSAHTRGTGGEHSSEGLLAESDIAPVGHAVEGAPKLGEKDNRPFRSGHSSEGLLAEADVAPVKEVDDREETMRKNHITALKGEKPFKSGHSSEGLLAESDVAPIEGFNDQVSSGRSASTAVSGDEPFHTGHSSEGFLAESDVAPAVNSKVDELAETRVHPDYELKRNSKANSSVKSAGESDQGWVAEADVSPAISPAVEEAADKKSHEHDLPMPIIADVSISDFEESADLRAKELQQDTPVSNILQAATMANDMVHDVSSDVADDVRADVSSDVRGAKEEVKGAAKNSGSGFLGGVAKFANSLFGGTKQQEEHEELKQKVNDEVVTPVARKSEELADSAKGKAREVADTTKAKLEDGKEWVQEKAEDVKEGAQEEGDKVEDRVAKPAARKGEELKENIKDDVIRPAARKGEEIRDDVSRSADVSRRDVRNRPGDIIDKTLDEAGAIMDEVEAKRAELRRKADELEREAKEIANDIRAFGGECVTAEDGSKNLERNVDENPKPEGEQKPEEEAKELKQAASEAKREFKSQGAMVANQDLIKDVLRVAGESEGAESAGSGGPESAEGDVEEGVWNAFKDDREANYQAKVEGDALWNEFKQDNEEGSSEDLEEKVKEADTKKKTALSEGRVGASEFEQAAKERAENTQGRTYK